MAEMTIRVGKKYLRKSTGRRYVSLKDSDSTIYNLVSDIYYGEKYKGEILKIHIKDNVIINIEKIER